MQHEVLFEDDSYHVVLDRPEGVGEASPFVVTFLAFSREHDALEPGPFRPGFGVEAILSLGFSCISVSPSKNDWYQGESATAAMAAIRSRVPENCRLVTYGSSMGGFAAINFSGILRADYFLSISPQATINPEFFESIGDKRWKYERSVIERHQDHILNGGVSACQGVIIYDDQLPNDNAHALACAQGSSGEILPVPFAGHPAGAVVNRSYGLKRILADICNGTFRKDSVAEVLAEQAPQTLNYLASDARHLDLFAKRYLESNEQLSRQTLVVLVRAICALDYRPTHVELAFCTSLLRAGANRFKNHEFLYRKLNQQLSEALEKPLRNE